MMLRPHASHDMNAPKYHGELVFHMAIFEALRGKFFWQCRNADGWVISESEALFSDPHDCVANACEHAARMFDMSGAHPGVSGRGAGA